ncbi:conserved exported hypothetical protein [Frankia canadensis]|uniref:DUF2993 domain-containing protein n=1 Tax=Frankia canadensis TaxID=1836972 RepID=A0A2I2KWI7_9ACTN|nr:DUF2993 domain-containing protein [Frankia canadensis]SNQ50022.1 conserved exported hypothetical protein [Frankia canadensis]SOU57312.1 conserved exported hypothetical protein [Frankia canadensis]
MSGSHRGLRITAVVVVVLLGLLVAVDRIAARVVAGQIAIQAQRSDALSSRPDVSLGGFPFLTQVVAGDYRDVRVDVRGQVQQGVRVDRVHADLAGVRVPLGDVVRGQVRQVPVDHLTARVELTFADINTYLHGQGSALTIGAQGEAIRVAGSVAVLGTSYPVSGTADIGVAPAAVTFTPRELAASVGAVLPPALRQSVGELLTVRVPIAGLPFNMRLTSATVAADRIVFAASGQNVVLDPNATIGTGTPTSP